MDPVLLVVASVVGLLALAMVLFARRKPETTDDQLSDTVFRLAENQAELAGRIMSISEQTAAAQTAFNERLQAQERAITKTLDDRLSDMTRRVGESLHKQTLTGEQSMGDLKERLAAINAAQSKITQLSEQVVSLQDVLTNKQARGGFGETQLEDLIRTTLPPSAYDFQVQMGNGKMADCLLRLPNPPGSIAVDSKFPFESFNVIRQTPDGEDRTKARKAFGRDVLKHVHDIREKYIIAGETSDSALMFIPSEAVYAELHAELQDVIEKSHRARVYIVSPTTLMALLNTIRAVLKDAQMKEAASLIQQEVAKMSDDVVRLDDRVDKLQKHFDHANEDVRQIRVSCDKITRRASRMEEIELGETPTVDPSLGKDDSTAKEQETKTGSQNVSASQAIADRARVARMEVDRRTVAAAGDD
ncbi:MAG: DNA recombination protein RmuC [Alphaproteobacteria bacterium]